MARGSRRPPANDEFAVEQSPDVVFKVGNHYVRIKSIDQATGEVTVEERPASEYTTIDRAIGAPIPDFDFTDFDGKQRRLSDFGGKFVLLDFWGTWCGQVVRAALTRGGEARGQSLGRASARLEVLSGKLRVVVEPVKQGRPSVGVTEVA